MYAGHLAAALALKAKEPRAPTWALVLGVGFIDVLFGLFLLVGIEHATITPDQAPGFRLDDIQWSHSLLMSLVWAALFGAAFLKRGKIVAAFCGLAVFSHFLLDFPMHPGDMRLWPHSDLPIGAGIWTRLPNGWWFVELGFIAACAAYYLVRARSLRTFGGRGAIAVAVVMLFHVLNAPWLPKPH